MSITNGLREYVSGPAKSGISHICEKAILHIADRIDAEYDQIHDFCERLESAVTDREDVTLWGVDYIALPLDADGEAWHVGDLAVGEVNPRNPKKVERMLWYGPDSGWQLETDTIIFPCPERVRHHHAPTVEDVLREFGDWYAHTKGGCDEDGIVAEYAAKLRLANE